MPELRIFYSSKMICDRAIERAEFRGYYQPIVPLVANQLSGFETLVRWHHPEKGIIGPDEFISVAEETGLISVIGPGSR